MSRLIDADKLLKRTKFYSLPNGNRAIDEIDILHAPTVQAIPLAKVKQARKEIENLEFQIQSYHNDDPMISQSDVLKILDNLIESEEK